MKMIRTVAIAVLLGVALSGGAAEFRTGLLDPAGFRNYSGNTSVRISNRAATVTVNRPGRFDSVFSIRLEKIPQKRKFHFAGEIVSTRNVTGYLAVKFFRNGAERARLESRSGLVRGRRAFIDFDTGDADRIELICRVPQDRSMVGQSVTFRNLLLSEGNYRDPAKAVPPRLEAVPGYASCSLNLSGCRAKDSGAFSSRIRYRRMGDPVWCAAQDFVYIPAEKAARSCLFNLAEGGDYEVEVEWNDAGKREKHSISFQTRSGDVPVAKTVLLGPENVHGRLVIRESGTPEGYIRYTAAKDFTLRAAPGAYEAVLLENVSYVILDGLTIRGGKRFGVDVVCSSEVILRNCDIAEFGELGKPVLELGNRYVLNGEVLSNIAGIRLLESEGILVERCYIHDSRGKTVPWFYSHPDGPFGILAGAAEQTTIRWNDIVGSEEFRWNDAIGGLNNGSDFGGLSCDAEVYGNYLAFANDDGIELDGGQRNTRFFRNKVEGTLCGVSTAPCLSGPSWIFDNLFCNPGDCFQVGNLALKNTFQLYGKGRISFFNNTIVGNWSGMSGFYSVPVRLLHPDELKAVSRNNLFAVNSVFFTEEDFKLPVDFDHDLFYSPLPGRNIPTMEKHAVAAKPKFRNAAGADYRLTEDSPGFRAGVPIAGLHDTAPDIGATTELLPERPVGFRQELQQLDFDRPGSRTVKVHVDRGWSGRFRIRRNRNSDFFSVSPASGVFRPGKTVTFHVTVHPEKLPEAKLYSGAFLISTPEGWSRPVTVRADFRGEPGRLAVARRGVIYGTVTPQNENGECEIEFQLKKPGAYYLFGFTSQMPWAVHLTPEGETRFQRAGFYGILSPERPLWCAMSTAMYSSRNHMPMKLDAGTHRFRITRRANFYYQLEAVALAERPEQLLNSPYSR